MRFQLGSKFKVVPLKLPHYSYILQAYQLILSLYRINMQHAKQAVLPTDPHALDSCYGYS